MLYLFIVGYSLVSMFYFMIDLLILTLNNNFQAMLLLIIGLSAIAVWIIKLKNILNWSYIKRIFKTLRGYLLIKSRTKATSQLIKWTQTRIP